MGNLVASLIVLHWTKDASFFPAWQSNFTNGNALLLSFNLAQHMLAQHVMQRI